MRISVYVGHFSLHQRNNC